VWGRGAKKNQFVGNNNSYLDTIDFSTLDTIASLMKNNTS
jgi:hypothetical protein